jgi:hypothetical protein
MKETTAICEQCILVKNMLNDEGKLFIQVYNSKGELIAVDHQEFSRRIEQLEGTVEFMHKQVKEREEQVLKNNRDQNQRWQKMSEAFDKYKITGADMVNGALEAITVLSKMVKRKRTRFTREEHEKFYKAQQFFKELNSINGKFKNFHEQNYVVGRQDVTNTELKR